MPTPPPPPPSIAVAPVTNGDFFRGVEFNRLQSAPNAAGIEESLFIFGAQRANELDSALATASQSRVDSTERLNDLNEVLAGIQNNGPGATVPLSLNALVTLNNNTPSLITPGVGVNPTTVTAPTGPAFNEFVQSLNAAGLNNLAEDFIQLGAGATVQLNLSDLSPAALAVFDSPGVTVNPGSVVLPADPDQLESFTQSVENAINQASSESQLDLIQFQALINRRNQTAEFLANLIQRFFGNRERIAGNLRA